MKHLLLVFCIGLTLGWVVRGIDIESRVREEVADYLIEGVKAGVISINTDAIIKLTPDLSVPEKKSENPPAPIVISI